MRELDRTFGSLDDVPAPDLWGGIRDREPQRPAGGPPGRRILVLVTALALAASAISFAAVAFLGGSPRPNPSPPVGTAATSQAPAAPFSVSGTTADGSVRCTATVRDTEIEPGERLDVTFSIENLGTEPFHFSRWILAGGRIVVRVGTGAVVWDEKRDNGFAGRSVPAPVPTQLPPGRQESTHESMVAVRWAGPLEVTPTCDYGVGALEPVTVDIVAPGPTPTPDEAVARVISALSPVFDACAPGRADDPVTGELRPPAGQDFPPMTARCRATVEEQEGFSLVTLEFVAPADAPLVDPLPEDSFGVRLPGQDPIEVARWTFVVTADAARVVDPTFTVSRTVPADRMAPEFELDNGSWSGGGASRCGGELYAGGPVIQFGSVCSS